MPALKPETIIPNDEEDAIINSGIASDPDTYEMSEKDFTQLKPYYVEQSQAIEEVTIELSTEVIAAFRETGPDWSARINTALKEWLHDHHTIKEV